MNIRQLETFVRIIELGSFGAAAGSLHTTQSTVSARIRELEKSLGVELFDRNHHRAQATIKAQALLEPARQMLALASGISQDIADDQSFSGLVRMGVAGRIAITWLPRLMCAMRHRYPRLTFDIDVSLSTPTIDKLRTGDLDLALMAASERLDSTDLVTTSLGFDDFDWMASPSLGLPAGPTTPADLARWPMLGLSEQSPHFPAIAQWFEADGASYRPVVSCNSLSVIAEMAAAGLGVAMLHRTSYRHLLDSGKLRVLDTVPAAPRIGFVGVHRRNLHSPLVTALMAMAVALSEFSSESTATHPGSASG